MRAAGQVAAAGSVTARLPSAEAALDGPARPQSRTAGHPSPNRRTRMPCGSAVARRRHPRAARLTIRATASTISPAIVAVARAAERYMSAAGKINRLAVGDAAVGLGADLHRAADAPQRERMSERCRSAAARRPPILPGRRRVPKSGFAGGRTQADPRSRQPNDIELRLDRQRAPDTVGGDVARSVVDVADRLPTEDRRSTVRRPRRTDRGGGARSCGRVFRENRAARGPARARVVGRHLRVRGRPRRSDGRRDDRHHRAVQRCRRWRYGEPSPDFRMPAVGRIGRRLRRSERGPARPTDVRVSGAAALLQFYRLAPTRRPRWVAHGPSMVAHGDSQWVATATSIVSGIESPSLRCSSPCACLSTRPGHRSQAGWRGGSSI